MCHKCMQEATSFYFAEMSPQVHVYNNAGLHIKMTINVCVKEGLVIVRALLWLTFCLPLCCHLFKIKRQC